MEKDQRDSSIEHILIEMKRHRAALEDLQEILVLHAKSQAEIENLYDELVLLAYEGISFLEALKVGDCIDAAWIATREDMLERASKAVLGPDRL